MKLQNVLHSLVNLTHSYQSTVRPVQSKTALLISSQSKKVHVETVAPSRVLDAIVLDAGAKT